MKTAAGGILIVLAMILPLANAVQASGREELPGPLDKVSRNPAIVRGQLDLGRMYARQALQRLRTSPSTETTESLTSTIQRSYALLSRGTSGLRFKRDNARFPDPLLETVVREMDKAMVHIRNAHHGAQSISTGRPELIQKIIHHLEETIAIVDSVVDLV